MRIVKSTASKRHVAHTHAYDGVEITTHIRNYSTQVVYTKTREGILLPVTPAPSLYDQATPKAALLMTKTWRVNGKAASEEFYMHLMRAVDTSAEIANLYDSGTITRISNGYEAKVTYLLPLSVFDTVPVVYLDGFDVIAATDVLELGEHPYSKLKDGGAIMKPCNSNFMLTVDINSHTPNDVYWLACPNGVFPVYATCDEWRPAGIEVKAMSDNDEFTTRREIMTIEEALKGDKLKLFRTVTEANLFLSGDTVKANLIMLEAEAKIKKLEMAIKEGELSSSRAAVEHEAKLQALALESKNMKQKGVVESIKIVPVIGTLFGLVAGFFSGIFG